MHIELKDYQEKAVVKLRNNINELLDTNINEVLVFKSPTGSGKTLMMAETIRRVTDSRTDNKRLAFIWLAVNKLHDQSRNSLKAYYENEASSIKCSSYQELENRLIQENEILFLNWASINKKGNVYIRSNERENDLKTVVERTRSAGQTIVLVIDESHHTAGSDKSKELIALISPKVTIEVSATPQIASDNIVPVRIDDVRNEGMIKKEVIVNDKFENVTVDKQKPDVTADEIVLKNALDKRTELARLLEKENSQVNPLLLIQLPDKKTGLPDKKEVVLEMLKKFGYIDGDPRLAIYLTGNEKINLDNIEKPQNEVEVMLFKQAIALGWDCPRAAILVLFRQWTDSNITFSIQTLGRIMRMPEQKHYNSSPLNNAYLFTSLPDIEARIYQSDMKSEIKPYQSLRIERYEDINLTSYHTKRHREETRLSSDFVQIFIDAAIKINLDKKVSSNYSIPMTKLIASGSIKDTDQLGHIIESSKNLEIRHNEVELQLAFDAFVRDNLEPFYPEQRSIKRVNESIYAFFGARRDEDKWFEVQAMVLADENRQAVIDTITLAKEAYLEIVGKGKQVLVKNDEQWNVPQTISFDISYQKKPYSRSVLQPYYATTNSHYSGGGEEDSTIEIAFIDFLEKASGVDWWFKNGSSDLTYFAVPYNEQGVDRAFYVDFVVRYKDGTIGLFDTKDGITATTAAPRAEGLAQYVAQENQAGKKLVGGIVIKDGNSWRLNDNKKYNYNPNDLSNWKILSFS